MELELRQETVRGWETVCRTTLEQEETAEAIVPDARPDIWQVLDGQARLLLQRNEAQDGRGELAGLLKTTILYQPEGGQGVEAMEVTLPFSAAPGNRPRGAPGAVGGRSPAQPPKGAGTGGVLPGTGGL